MNEQKKKASKEVATDKNEVRRIWEPIFLYEGRGC